MGRRLVVCPNGKYAIFSTIADDIIIWDFTREEFIEEYVQEATERARAEATAWVDTERPGRRHWTPEEILETIKTTRGEERAKKVRKMLLEGADDPDIEE